MQKNQKRTGTLSLTIAAIFMIIVGVSVFSGTIPILILGIYIVVSFATFLLYAKDKSAAKNGAWRTPENTLHFFSLLGGWPGAIAAQQKLSHKSKKQSFRIVFWITVLLNCSLYFWFYTSKGSETLSSLINSLSWQL